LPGTIGICGALSLQNCIGDPMKSLLLCLLMTSILMASYHGSSAPQLRRLLLNR
jgi:hypothetical protein